MEKMTREERVSVGAVTLLAMIGVVLGVGTLYNAVTEGVGKKKPEPNPVPVTKISVEGPGVSWTAEKTNTVVRWPKPSDCR